MSVRIQNKGQRNIGVAKGKYIKPGQVGIVTDDTAKRLVRLYPDELIDIDNIKASFNESEVNDLTKEDAAAKEAEKKAAEAPKVKTPSELKAEKKAAEKAAKEAEAAEAQRLADEEAQRELDEEEAARKKQEEEDEADRLANEGGKSKKD